MRPRLALAVAALGVAGLLVPASAAPVPDGATWTEMTFPSADGTVLHADVLLPSSRRGRVPVILSAGPYFAHAQPAALAPPEPTASGPRARFNDLVRDGRVFERGYALVPGDTRGYGESGGCTDMGGPLEQADVKAAVEWAAAQPWSTGKVGLWGKSYDAWTEVMALATRPKGLAAVVVQSPLDSGYKAVFDSGVRYGGEWPTYTAAYQGMTLTPPTVDDGADAHARNVVGTADPACYAAAEAGALDPDPGTAFWRSRDLVARAGASRVPVLWSHGFNDLQTKPTNLLDTWTRLGGPKRGWFGQWEHVRGTQVADVGRGGFLDEAMAWLGHYLKGEPLPSYPGVRVQDSEGTWRVEAAWPPADVVARRMPLLPGSYLDVVGSAADAPTGGTWTVSQPSPHDVRLAGALRLRATVTAPVPATLVATVYDVPPSGPARLLTRGATVVSGSSVDLALWPEDWLLVRGHRLAVHLSGDDALVYQPVPTGTTVTVTGGAVELPVLTRLRRTDVDGGPASAQRPTADLDPQVLAGRQGAGGLRAAGALKTLCAQGLSSCTLSP